MKRVDFDPTGAPGSTGPGGRNIQNRGVSKYVRISWDEALDIVTGEMKRMKETYGPTAILYQNDQHGENKTVHGPHGCGRKLLDLFGGYTHQVRNADSWEGWYWGAKHVWGCEYVGQQLPQSNLLYDISKNAELLLFWGCDPETTPWGWGGQLVSRLNYWWTELGIRQIYIAPDCNYGNAVHADKWIPILPNTDAALYLAIAYQWFKNGTYDKEYLETHAYGVDKFEDYVMGAGGRRAQDPRVGVAHHRRARPHHQGPGRRMGLQAHHRGHLQRRSGHPRPLLHRARAPAGALPGHAGAGQAGLQPGQDDRVGPVPHRRTDVAPAAVSAHDVCRLPRRAPAGDKQHSFIPKTLVPKPILEGEGDWYGNRCGAAATREDQFVQYKYPADGCSQIHMIWTDSPSWITCWNDGNNFIRAMRHPDIEFIMCQHPWIENDALFADVLLPVNTKLEEDDIGTDVFSGQMDLLFPEPRCMEPLGETFSDYEIVCKIAERLGLLEEYTGGKSVADIIRIGYETLRRRRTGQLGGVEREGLLRRAARSRLGEHPGRADRVLRGSGESPALDAHRQAGVLLHRVGRALPRRPGAAAGAQVDPQGRDAPGDASAPSGARSTRCWS